MKGWQIGIPTMTWMHAKWSFRASYKQHRRCERYSHNRQSQRQRHRLPVAREHALSGVCRGPHSVGYSSLSVLAAEVLRQRGCSATQPSTPPEWQLQVQIWRRIRAAKSVLTFAKRCAARSMHVSARCQPHRTSSRQTPCQHEQRCFAAEGAVVGRCKSQMLAESTPARWCWLGTDS